MDEQASVRDDELENLRADRIDAIMIANEESMGQILVRKIDDTLKRKLQRRAEKHGHSMEEEVRDILRDALKEDAKPEKGLGTQIAERFRGIGLTEPIEEFRGFTIEPVKFDE